MTGSGNPVQGPLPNKRRCSNQPYWRQHKSETAPRQRILYFPGGGWGAKDFQPYHTQKFGFSSETAVGVFPVLVRKCSTASGKGATARKVKNRQKCQEKFDDSSRWAKRQKVAKQFSTLFDNFRAAPIFQPLLGLLCLAEEQAGNGVRTCCHGMRLHPSEPEIDTL